MIIDVVIDERFRCGLNPKRRIAKRFLRGAVAKIQATSPAETNDLLSLASASLSLTWHGLGSPQVELLPTM